MRAAWRRATPHRVAAGEGQVAGVEQEPDGLAGDAISRSISSSVWITVPMWWW